MRVATAVSLAASGRLPILRAAAGLSAEVTRALFLTGAARAGLLRALASGPLAQAQIAEALGMADAGGEPLRAWLAVGSAVGELEERAGRWQLAGRMARGLAEARNDDVAAILEEVTTLHARLLLESPQRLHEGRRFTLADQDGEVIARSSRIVEPLIREVVAEYVPSRGAFRLLEVGCGSGIYLRCAAERNPDLTALGLELQEAVARHARQNLAEWKVGSRVQVESGDLRQRAPGPRFDLVTLHNNIYYFPVAERVAVLRHALGFLAPAGQVLLTTACPGGSPSGAVLHLWGEMTDGCGGLPEPEVLCRQLAEAGFADVKCRNVGAPVERFFAFSGTRR